MISLLIASDIDYDNIVCEISDDNDFLCLLSQEEGDEQVMIELPIELPAKGPESFCRIALKAFLDIVGRAKENLISPQDNPETK